MNKKKFNQIDIGKVPKDWIVKEIKEIAKITTGHKNTQDAIECGKYPFYVRSQTVERINSYSFDTEGVITAGDGDIGKIFHYVNGKFDLHQRAYLIYGFKKVFPKYFYWYFSNNFYKRVHSMSAKCSVDSIRLDMISDMKIIFPQKLEEQIKISTFLSDINSIILSLEKLIKKKNNIKQATMQQLLTGKTRLANFAQTNEYINTEIGYIPKDWKTVKISDFAQVFDGTHQTPQYFDYGIPFYSVENVTSNDFTHTKFISKEEHELLSAKAKIEKGDILMTRIGSIGDCKYVDWEPNASFYVSLALIKCNNFVDSKFISYYSNSTKFKNELQKRSLLTATPQKINLGPISEIELYIPPTKQEQSAIAEILYSMDKDIQTLNRKLEKYYSLKQGMMNQLLTGTIRLI